MVEDWERVGEEAVQTGDDPDLKNIVIIIEYIIVMALARVKIMIISQFPTVLVVIVASLVIYGRAPII